MPYYLLRQDALRGVGATSAAFALHFLHGGIVTDRAWVTYARAAEALQLSKAQVGWLGSVGQLDVQRLGNRWHVSRDSMEALVSERAR